VGTFLSNLRRIIHTKRLIILLIPMSDSPRFVSLVSLFVAISFIDFLPTAREILEEVDPDPKE
jgi:hypothetical protein